MVSGEKKLTDETVFLLQTETIDIGMGYGTYVSLAFHNLPS